MTKALLQYRAAKLTMGRLDADEIKSTIENLMREDVFLEEFLDTLNAPRPRWEEATQALLAAFKHFGITLPDTNQAMLQLIEHHLKAIASGAEDPLDRFERLLADVDADHDLDAQSQMRMGDSHGIEQLVSLYWSACELRELRERVAHNSE